MVLLFNQALTRSEGAKVLYHFCRLQAHIHTKLTYTEQRKKKMRTGGKGKEIKTKGKRSSNFPKALAFQASHTNTYTCLP